MATYLASPLHFVIIVHERSFYILIGLILKIIRKEFVSSDNDIQKIDMPNRNSACSIDLTEVGFAASP